MFINHSSDSLAKVGLTNSKIFWCCPLTIWSGLFWCCPLTNFMKRSGRLTGPSSFKRAKSSSKKTSAITLFRSGTVPAVAKKRIELKRKTARIIAQGGLIGSSGVSATFPAIDAGDNSDEREGRCVQIKGWELRGRIWGPQLTGGGCVRVIVVQWYQGNNYAMVMGDILDTAGGTIDLFDAPYNINTVATYRVLYDKVYDVTSFGRNLAGDGFTPNLQPVTLYGKVNFDQTYSANNQITLQNNAIKVLVIPTDPGSSAFLTGSVTYVDI